MMHIALTIDSKFVRYCAVTIVSILEIMILKISCYILYQGIYPKKIFLLCHK